MYPASRSEKVTKVEPIGSDKKTHPIKYDPKISNVSFKNKTEITPQKKMTSRIIDLEKKANLQKTVKKQDFTIWSKLKETHNSLLTRSEQEITSLEKEIFVRKLLDNCSGDNIENISTSLNAIEKALVIRLDLIEKIKKTILLKLPNFDITELQLIPNFYGSYATLQEKIEQDLVQLNALITVLCKTPEETLEYCLKQSILCAAPLDHNAIVELASFYDKAQEESLQALFSNLKFPDQDTRSWLASIINILKQSHLKQLKTTIEFLLNIQHKLYDEYKNVHPIIISELYNALRTGYLLELEIVNFNGASFINHAKVALETSIKKYKKAQSLIEENMALINLHKLPLEHLETSAMTDFKILKSSLAILKNDKSPVFQNTLEQLKLINLPNSAETTEALKTLSLILDTEAKRLKHLENLVLKIAHKFTMSAQQLSSFYLVKSGAQEYQILTVASESRYLASCKSLANETMKLFPKTNGLSESEYLAVLQVLNLKSHYILWQSIQQATVFDENLVDLLSALGDVAKTFPPTLRKQSDFTQKLLIRLSYSIELLDASINSLKEYSEGNSLIEILIESSKTFHGLYQNSANLDYESWINTVDAKIKYLGRIYYELIADSYFPKNEKFSVLTEIFNMIHNAQVLYTTSWENQLNNFKNRFCYKLLLAECKAVLQNSRLIISEIISAEEEFREISSKYNSLHTARANLEFFENMVKETEAELMSDSKDSGIMIKLSTTIKDCRKIIKQSQTVLANSQMLGN